MHRQMKKVHLFLIKAGAYLSASSFFIKVGSTGGETELKTLEKFSRCTPVGSALS